MIAMFRLTDLGVIVSSILVRVKKKLTGLRVAATL